jgi:hypothetical protein
MSNLTRYDNNGLELVINTVTGEAFASISAVARMTDKNKSTISRYVNGTLETVAQMALLEAEVNTADGLRSVALLNENQILEVVTRYKPELLAEFAKLGLRMVLHQLAGYEVKSNAVGENPKQLTRVEEAKRYLKMCEELELAEAQVKLLEQDNERQAEVIDELFDYSSIIRIAKYNQCSEKEFNWRKLKVASQALNLEIKKVPCPRFETKNLYSHDVWRLAYPEYKVPETTTLIIKH